MNWAECISLSARISADDPRVYLCDEKEFRCPVCHSPVFHRKAGGRKKHNEFVHYHDETPYCSLRTVSSSGISIDNQNLQKSPFNLYLSSDDTNYHLSVQFRSVPDKFASLSDKWFSITDMGLKYQISEFLDGGKQKSLPYPPSWKNCTLSYDKELEILKMMNSWGAYIDYFFKNAAFFNVSTGMKIPVGDTLYCNTEYIFICTDNSVITDTQLKGTYEKMFERTLGIFHSRRGNYPVVLIKFPDLLDEKLLSFAKYYNHTLSEKSAEPLLLWPPAIRKYDINCTIYDDAKLYIKTNNASKREIWAIDESVRDVSPTKCTTWGDSILVFISDFDQCSLKIKQGTATDTLTFSIGSALFEIASAENECMSARDIDGIETNAVSKIATIQTNFISNSIVIQHNGLRKTIVSTKGILHFKETMDSIWVYNYHDALVMELCNEQVHNDKNASFPLNQLRSHNRVLTPYWVDIAIRNYSKENPVNARLSKQSCSNGSISRELLFFLKSWR